MTIHKAYGIAARKSAGRFIEAIGDGHAPSAVSAGALASTSGRKTTSYAPRTRRTSATSVSTSVSAAESSNVAPKPLAVQERARGLSEDHCRHDFSHVIFPSVARGKSKHGCWVGHESCSRGLFIQAFRTSRLTPLLGCARVSNK
jgi:hypothetical protein